MIFEVNHLSKTFHTKKVLSDFSMCLENGKIYCLLGPSGIGKTTLLRILMNLEQPDGGEKENPWLLQWRKAGITAVFQENRLFEFADAIKNIRISGGENLLFSPKEVLNHLLEEEALCRPVGELSGGMKRRVAIARALCVPSDVLLMDEPFAGLDPATRERAIQAILQYRDGRTCLVVTHQEADAEKLGAEIIRLGGREGKE